MKQPTFKEFYAAWTEYQEFIAVTAEAKKTQARSARQTKKKRRQDTARAGKYWTDQEKNDVVTDYKSGMTMLGLARKYGRTQKAVHDRLWHATYGLLRTTETETWQPQPAFGE